MNAICNKNNCVYRSCLQCSVFFLCVSVLSQSVAGVSYTGKIKGVSAAQSEQLHWGWKKAEPYVFFKSQSLPLVYWLRGLIGMYICINTAISDPLCVCACVWPGEARRALPDWFTKGKGCFTLVTGSWRATKKKKKKSLKGGGWDSTPTQTETGHPAGEKRSHPCPADSLFLPHLTHTNPQTHHRD